MTPTNPTPSSSSSNPPPEDHLPSPCDPSGATSVCTASPPPSSSTAPMPAPFGRNPSSGSDDVPRNVSLTGALNSATTMDANVHSAVLSGLAQQLMNVTVPQPLQLTPQASTYRHNLIMSMAAAQLNNTLQQQAFAAVSAAAPAMFQYLPAAASAATESAPAPGFYYQPILTANTAAPNFCTCACFPNTCPVHGYEIASTANATNSANVQAQTNLTTSLFGSPFRTVVLPQPQVMTASAPPPTPAAPAPSSFPAALMMQQRLLSVSQAATSNASSHAASEAAANALRMKRQNAYHNGDGRPAKVRRVLPDTSSTPSSSQPLMDSAPEVYPSLHVDPPAPIIRPARSCASCHNVFSAQHQPSPMCLCHRSLSCEYSQMVCATCFLSVTTNRQPDMVLPRIANNFESAMNHQQSLARRQADRNLQATQYFYQTNQNYVQLAAAQSAAATSAPTASPLMVVNSRPFEFLFFTGDQSQPNVLLTGTAAHNLQQLQQVLTNGPVHEPPPVGATLDQIKKTTSICNYTKDPNVPEQERDRCTVCLCDFETGDEVRALNCSHMFHVDCIDRWLVYNKKCPVCRVEMDKTIDYPTPLGYEDDLYATAPTEAATVAAPAAAAS